MTLVNVKGEPLTPYGYPQVAIRTYAASTSGSPYTMYAFAGSGRENIYVAPRAGVLHALSCSFVNTVNSANTVRFFAYINGQSGNGTPATAMTTTQQDQYVLTGAISFTAGTTINIACYPSGSPGGTLTVQSYLSVIFS